MADARLAGRWLAAAALTLLAVGCGEKPAPRADLVFINGAEPETLDPALMSGQSDMRLAYALFEGLTAFDADGQPRPGVAARWDLSPDGTVYTFHLRPDARWSDGARVTAADFVHAWQRVLTPANAAQYAGQLYCLKNGTALQRSRRPSDRLRSGRRACPGRRHAARRSRTRHAILPRPVLPARVRARAAARRATLGRRLDPARAHRHRRPVPAGNVAAQRAHPPAPQPALLGLHRRASGDRGRAADQPGERRAELLCQRLGGPHHGQGPDAAAPHRRTAPQALFPFRPVPGRPVPALQLHAAAL